MFDLGFVSFKRIDGATKSFRNETGLLNSQTSTEGDKIKSVESSMKVGGKFSKMKNQSQLNLPTHLME